MTIDRKQQLTERIANMLKLKEEELKLKKPNSGFINDVNETIAACERELRFLNKNRGGVTFVNGA